MNNFQNSIKDKLEYIARPFKPEEYGQIIQVCSEIIAEDSDCYEAFSARSHVYYRLGMYTEALCDVGRLIQLRPKSPVAYIRRAGWYLERGEYGHALADAKVVIESGDEYFANVAYFYRAMASLNLGSKADAMDACRNLPDDFKFYVKIYNAGGKVISRDDLCKLVNGENI